MAVVSPIPVIPQRINRIRYPDIDFTGMMVGSRSEIVEDQPPVRVEPALRVVEEKLYVAVCKEVKESELTLAWALHNRGTRKICILHIHQPAQKIPMMGTKWPIDRLEQHQVIAHHENERQSMHKLLDKYSQICERTGASVEKLHLETDTIEKGIVELISKHGIKKLVMGAAADKQYSRRMTEPRSKKAIYVRLQAPDFCQISFLCKGKVIFTRRGNLYGDNVEVTPPSVQASPNTEIGQDLLRSRSVAEGHNDQLQLTSSSPGYRRVRSENYPVKMSFYSIDGTGGSTPHSRSNAGGSSGEWNGISRRSPSTGSCFSTSSLSEALEDLPPISLPSPRTKGREHDGEFGVPHHSEEHLHYSSPFSVLQEGTVNNEIYDQLEQVNLEAANSKREAYEESIRRRKAEKDAIEAIRRAKASERLYGEELRQNREIAEALARGKEEFEKTKQQIEEVMEELWAALDQKTGLESQITNSEQMVEELKVKIFSAVELLQNYKKERDELQVERDDALRLAEELRKKQSDDASRTRVPQLFSEFGFSEIEVATRNFDSSFKIGEGGYGSIYRGFLRNTDVAIKILNSHSKQGPSEFQQEVNVLSKLRHPNLVTLIGACPEAWILIYEYLPNGSLEDRLTCRNNTPPISWQTRIRIAAELCSVLIFLHAHSIVHGDLKPANLLLDDNYVSRLSDFGICRVLSQDDVSSNNTTICCVTDPKGTPVYMDPEFLTTGELTPKSDVYSFGLILLRLLTGKPALKLSQKVQYALDDGHLKDLLDPTAGDWPFVQAKQLAHLALCCCEMNRRRRPDLASEVWRVIEPMRVSCGFSSFRLGSEVRCQTPSYFICPIFQEIMQDPVVAADGFTYEAEALKGWLDNGQDKSPMTDLALAHTNVVPNHALRSAIQEWQQQP